MTTYTLRKGAAEKTKTDVVVIGVVQGLKGLTAAPGGEGVAAAYGRKFAPLLSTIGFTARPGDVAKVPTAGVVRSPLLIMVGMGRADAVDAAAVRRAAGVAIRSLSNAASVTLALPAADEHQVRAVVEGAILGGYSFSEYKSASSSKAPGEVVVLTDIARSKGATRAASLAQIIGSATALARDWVNTPPGDFTPERFADAVVAEHEARKPPRTKLSVTDEAELHAGGFGGIIGVGQGSANPPRLVRLTYQPRGAKAHLALVGKGITFDSGGLSIKPGKSMVTMKCDMAGAAAVVAATLAIAELELPVRVSTFVPMAENMVSGTSTRPGDVLTMYGGRTVEVLNTDAEGRLVLADALVLAAEAEPDVILDVATLTGACETALGDRVGGVLGNDDALLTQVVSAGARAGEMFWPLPITPEMTEKVRTYSKVADERRWAHLDIAGPAFNSRAPYGHVPSGGTGVTVATLVELAAELAG